MLSKRGVKRNIKDVSQYMDMASKKSRAMARKRVYNRLPELKEKITESTGTLYAATLANGTLVSLINGVAEGADSNNRIGRKITHAYLDCKIIIKNFAAGSICDAGFWAIVLDRQPNGSLPAFSDIYDLATTSVAGLAPKNTLLYQDRFQVLATDTWSINAAAGGTGPYFCHRYVDLSKLTGRDRTAQFNGIAATIGDLNSGSIYFVCADANTSTTSVTGSSVDGVFKYRFYDM